MCIGNSFKPSPFKKKTSRQLGFDYNNKAWMTSVLFFGWLQRFSGYVTRTDPHRKVLRLIDNCSSHGCPDSLPVLENLEILFLPPNTTSKLKPMDAGIIVSLKARYLKSQYERALDLIDAGEKNIYKLDQLTGMRSVQKIWEELPGGIIRNCWLHIGLVGGRVTAGQRSTAEGDVLSYVRCAVRHLVSSSLRLRMAISSILNPEDENDCF